jgi:hypothetical protein
MQKRSLSDWVGTIYAIRQAYLDKDEQEVNLDAILQFFQVF